MKIIANIFVFTLLLVGVSGCKLKVQQPDPPPPTIPECNMNPAIPGCVEQPLPNPYGYKKVVSNKSFCLTSASACGAASSQPADTAWLSGFDSSDLTMTVSGNNMVASSSGIAYLTATDLQGSVIASYEANWSRVGQNIAFTNSYGINDWIDNLPTNVGEVIADVPIAFGAGYGYVQMNSMVNYNGAPLDMRMESFVQCDMIPGAPPSATAFLCDGE